MKLSVIIPVFNTGHLLIECLSSIYAQSFRDFEVIIVDDKSNDKITISVLESLDNSTAVIRLDQHLGAAYARNIGLKNAKGDYIIFLDSDDSIENDCFEKMFERIEAKQCDLCVCGHRRINADGLSETKLPRISSVAEYIESIDELGENAFELFPISTWAYIVKRDLLETNQISFQTLTLNNDVYYVIAILIKAQGIAIFGEKPLINHRVGLINQITASNDLWTVPTAFTYIMLREDIQENSSLYYKIMYLWLKSIPDGIKQCNNYFTALQTYIFISKIITNNSKFRLFSNDEINNIIENIRNNPNSIEWITDT